MNVNADDNDADGLDEPTLSSVGLSRLVSPDKRASMRTPDRRRQASFNYGTESGSGHLVTQSTPQVRKCSSSPVVCTEFIFLIHFKYAHQSLLGSLIIRWLSWVT
jgi:hypothetical protein